MSGKLTCCLIVKNEALNLPRLFENLKDVIDEWVVVDTGSTDSTKEVARSHGASVYDFEWTGDFAEARNFSNSKATGTWILSMDPDEIIEPTQIENIRACMDGAPNCLYVVPTRNYTHEIANSQFKICRGEYGDREKNYLGYFISRRVRFYPNLPTIRYSGALHEMVVSSDDFTVQEAPFFVHHYGNNLSSLLGGAKRDRYLEASEQKVKSDPSNWKAHYEVGIERAYSLKWQEAFESFSKANEICQKESPMVVASLACALIELGRIDEARENLYECLGRFPTHPDLLLNLGVTYFRENQWAESLVVFTQLCKSNPDSFMGFYYAGLAMEKMNSKEGALVCYNQSLHIFPKFDKALAAQKRLTAQQIVLNA